MNNVYCFFEQSGTFKNEFIKLGFNAFDYDIKNDFNQTDVVIDLFNEITNCYDGKPSIFDNITSNDLIFAFFPCIRFENQSELLFRGTSFSFKKWSMVEKLEYDLKLHKELDVFYETVTKLVIVCLKKNIPLIIENPYSTTHYLVKYWALKSTVIHKDRRLYGDYYCKPTQYFFVCREPSCNLFTEPICYKDNFKYIVNCSNAVERSLISSDYAHRFIVEYVL